MHQSDQASIFVDQHNNNQMKSIIRFNHNIFV